MTRWVAIIYFDGPASRWRRSAAHFEYELHDSVLSIPLPDAEGELMPAPDPDDIVQRRVFRWQFAARVWALSRVRGFNKLLAEVRPA